MRAWSEVKTYSLLRKSNRGTFFQSCKFLKRKQHSISPSCSVDEVTFPSKARVVICGGGIMGSSVAYHLAELGWGKHTVVLEKGRQVFVP